MFKPRLRLPRISIRLPKFKFPRIGVPLPRIAIPFGRIATVIGAVNTLLLVTLGSLGLLVSYINPIPWVSQYIEYLYGSATVTELFVQANFLQANLTYTVGASVVLIVFGLLLHVTSFKSWWHTLKATPMAVVRSPINAYKRVVIWRNWILAKITYLNEESQKWKTLFNVMKSPYAFLRMMGFSPQMAIGLLTVGATAGGGVVVNETILSERSFSGGDSGIYAASLARDMGLEGSPPLDVPTEYVEGSNTLRIDLGSTPVREITIENVSVGTVFTGSALPSGEANVVQISGNTISGGTNTRLEIGHLIFEKSRCKKLELSDIQAHTVLIKGNASDGQSISVSPGSSRMRAIGGGHQQADAMVTNGGTYDRIWIQAPASGVNGKIGLLKLSNLYTKGGTCLLSKMNIGTMEILLNEVGMGDGFATKEFTVATTVTGANITVEDNVEVTIAEPATAGH